MSKEKGIIISEKHGVNPSIACCEVCGKEYGVIMFGKLKDDQEAPKRVMKGLCPDCQKVVDDGGIIFIEVEDGSDQQNPVRTGRIIGLTKEWKERNNLDISVAYMEHTMFEQWFGKSDFQEVNQTEVKEEPEKTFKCPKGYRRN